MSDRINIIVAEDEPIVRNGVRRALQERGHHCEAVGTQGEVVKLIDRGFFPEVALIDVLLPEGRITRDFDNEMWGLTAGMRLAAFVKKEVDYCRIIISTGLDDYRGQAQQIGAWGYLCKPTHNFGVLFDILGQGYLKGDEIGKPTIDVNDLIKERLHLGRERKY